METDDRLVRLLGEVGFLAAGYGTLEEAQDIFAAVREARPNSEYADIGEAFAYINANQHDDAVRVLEKQGLAAHPDSTVTRVFLGLALHLGGRASESARELRKAVAANDDADAVRLAHQLLGGADASANEG